DPLINDLHLTRTQISTAYLIGTLTGAAALPWVGRALDRWGVRRLAIVIAAGFGAVLVGLSWVTDLVGLTFGYVAVRLAGQGALTLVATTAVALWFDRRRGTASGISTAVGGMGISLTPVLTEHLIAEFGWRAAWTAQGAAIWVTGLVGLPFGSVAVRLAGQGARTLVATTAVALWFDRRRGTASGISTAVGGMGISLTPVLTEHLIAEFGWRAAWTAQGVAIWVVLLPIAVFGLRGSPPVRHRPGAPGDGSRAGVGWALRTPLFWVITAGAGATGMLATALGFHQISLLGEQGLSARSEERRVGHRVR